MPSSAPNSGSRVRDLGRNSAPEPPPKRQLASFTFPLLIVAAVVLFIALILWIWTTSQERRDRERRANQPVAADVDPLEREAAARAAALERAAAEARTPFLVPARHSAIAGLAGASPQRPLGAPFNPREAP